MGAEGHFGGRPGGVPVGHEAYRGGPFGSSSGAPQPIKEVGKGQIGHDGVPTGWGTHPGTQEDVPGSVTKHGRSTRCSRFGHTEMKMFRRSRMIALATVMGLLIAGFVAGGTGAEAQTMPPPALSENDVSGVWAIRQGKPFSESVYALDIAGYSLRVHWKDVEPVRGQYDWSLVDSVLARAKQGGKKVRLSVMFGVGVPDWVGAQWFTGSADSPCDSAGAKIPVPWDPNLRREQLNLIRVFAERYRNDPAVAFLHIAGPSAMWEELCLPNNTTQLPGYSNQAILDVWKEVIDQWVAVRGNKRLSFAASAAPSFYSTLGNDIANYGISKLGRQFSPQWNYLDTKFASAVRIVSGQWTPKAPIGWQFWGATVWNRQTIDFEGTLRLAADVGSTYVEVYDDDLRVAELGRLAEQVHDEMRGTPSSTTTTTAPPPTTTAPPPTTTTTPPPPTTFPPSTGDSVAPSAPTGLRVLNRGMTSVTLGWSPSSDNVGVAHYVVTRNGTPVSRVNYCKLSLWQWMNNYPVRYGVRAVDSAGNVSPAATVTVEPWA